MSLQMTQGRHGRKGAGVAKEQAHSGADDEKLLKAVYSGDEAAIMTLLVDRCGSRLKYLVLRKFPMLRLSFEELLSEVYLKLSANDWKALRAFRGVGPTGKRCTLETYVSVIASRLLWKKTERAVKEIDWNATPIEGDTLNVDQAAFARSPLAAEVAEAIMLLDNPQDRIVLQLYKIDGLDTKEVAARLGISPGNVHTRCCRALKNLRAVLAEGNGHA